MTTAEQGSAVKFHLTARIDDGTELESTAGGDPVVLTIGDGAHHPMIEAALVGMATGESKTVDIPADQAFGPHHDELIQTIPRDRVPAEIELREGVRLEAQGEEGPVTVTVVSVDADTVTLDANHPLAGRDLSFDISVVEVG